MSSGKEGLKAGNLFAALDEDHERRKEKQRRKKAQREAEAREAAEAALLGVPAPTHEGEEGQGETSAGGSADAGAASGAGVDTEGAGGGQRARDDSVDLTVLSSMADMGDVWADDAAAADANAPEGACARGRPPRAFRRSPAPLQMTASRW